MGLSDLFRASAPTLGEPQKVSTPGGPQKASRSWLPAKFKATSAVDDVLNFAKQAHPFEPLSPESKLSAVGSWGPARLSRMADLLARFARHLDQNDSFLSNALNNLKTEVVGVGPTARPMHKELAPLWREWCKRADATGNQESGNLPFNLLVGKIYRESELTGGMFVVMRERRLEDGLVVPMQIQALGPERVPHSHNVRLNAGTRITQGIEIGPIDNVQAYHILPAYPNDDIFVEGSMQPVRVDARHVCHVFNPPRNGSPRGVTRALAAIVPLTKLRTYTDAEITRKFMVSSIAAFLVDQDGTGNAWFNNNPGKSAEEHAEDAVDYIEWKAGGIITVPHRKDVKFNTAADVAGDGFLRFFRLQVAAALNMPTELVDGDYGTGSDRTMSFGGTHWEMHVAEDRARIEHQLLNPIWSRFVDLAVATGVWVPPEGSTPEQWKRVEWIWPKRAYKNTPQYIGSIVSLIDRALIGPDTARDMLDQDGYLTDLEIAEVAGRRAELGIKVEGSVTVEATDKSSRLQALEAVELERDVAARELSEGDVGALR